MRTKFSLLLAATITTALFSTAKITHASGTLRTRLCAPPTTLDWNLAYTASDRPILMSIMEGLFTYDANTKLKPQLAKSYQVSPDGKTYTFHLKENVRWSDGKPLDAADFVFSWRRLLDPTTAAPFAYLLFDIEGAQEFASGNLKDPTKIGVIAKSAHELEIHLKQASRSFINKLALWATFPVRGDLVQRFGNAWTQAANIAVLGPFVPVVIQMGSHFVLNKNQRYHGKKPVLESIRLQIADDAAAMNLYDADTFDVVSRVNPNAGVGRQNRKALKYAPYLRSCFLSFNTVKVPADVRAAVAGSIDRQALVHALNESVIPANTLVPTALLKIKVSAPPSTELRSKPPVLVLQGESNDANLVVGQVLQEQLKKKLGLTLDLRFSELATYRSRLEHQDGDAFLRCWTADYPDPETFLAIFESTAPNNYSGFSNAQYDAAVRSGQYGQAQEQLLTNHVVAPLYFDQIAYLIKPRVQGFKVNAMGTPFFGDVRQK